MDLLRWLERSLVAHPTRWLLAAWIEGALVGGLIVWWFLT